MDAGRAPDLDWLDRFDDPHTDGVTGFGVDKDKAAGLPAVGISVGCIDDNDWFATQAVVYTKGRPAWDKTTEDVPNFERMPPPPK